MIDKFKDAFKEEAYELLNNLESSLLELEENPENKQEIDSTFRTMHTIKGSAAMFGFSHISQFTHEVETILDLVREGQMRVDKILINLTLAARDHIRELLECSEPLTQGLLDNSEDLINQFKGHVEKSRFQPEVEDQDTQLLKQKFESVNDKVEDVKEVGTGKEAAEVRKTYRINFRPNPEIMENGTNPLLLLKELQDLGEYTIAIDTTGIPELPNIEPQKCYIAWEIFLTSQVSINEIKDVFIFVEDSAEISILLADELSEDSFDLETKKLGQILVDRGAVKKEQVEIAASQQKRIGETLKEKGVSETEIQAALREQQHAKKVREKMRSEMTASSIRVSSEKLDQLVDLVGELVTLQARLNQTANETGDSTLGSISEQLERLISELRDNTMGIRMLPIGTTFSKFRRLVRDLSQDLGKQVELMTEGGETELDKTVIERLNDPLVHLIRNSIDHGIEIPSLRKEKGKPEKGTVLLSASHSGASVFISIKDDGAGFNRKLILEKALERGIISSGQELSDQEVYNLLFDAGFSTAKEVTKVSGRGVGLDVVKKEIENLGGTISLESTPGDGSEFILKIPLTLAIIEGLLVRIGEDKFVFPLSAVEECIELDHNRQNGNDRRNIINNRGEMLSYAKTRDILQIDGDDQDIEQVVVVNFSGEKLGFVVDEVIGGYQTVIKNLGKVYKHQIGISGATILGDGTVALIIDVQKLAQLVLNEEEKALVKS